MHLVAKYQFLSDKPVTNVTFLQDQVKDSEYKLNALAAEYDKLDNTKWYLVEEYIKRKDALYTAQSKAINNIAHEVLSYLQSIGILGAVGGREYEKIDKKYKNENALTFIKRLGLGSPKSTSLNTSVEENILEKVKVALEEAENLPQARKSKLIKQVEEEVKEHDIKKSKVKEQDFGIHQNEPPEGMQGPSAFSDAIHTTAEQFRKLADCMDKIEEEVKTYKPMNEERIQEKADDWNTCINETILGKIINPMFITETQAERDRKWTTSVFHWIGIIKNRIEQSKHGAGKMAENIIVDAFGRPVYNKKNKVIKKSISRERVGDNEWDIVDTAETMIGACTGIVQLHDWLENDQGGHRRYRKEFLHDYFAEASMGSIKSGNPEYEQWMREYKKKQLEKFKSGN